MGQGSFSEPVIKCLGGRVGLGDQVGGEGSFSELIIKCLGGWVGGRDQVLGWVGEESLSKLSITCFGGCWRGAVLNQISGVLVGGVGEVENNSHLSLLLLVLRFF